MHAHNPLSEKLTSMLGLPEEENHDAHDTADHGNTERLMNKLTGVFHEITVVPQVTDTNHDAKTHPQWVGAAPAALVKMQHHAGSTGLIPPSHNDVETASSTPSETSERQRQEEDEVTRRRAESETEKDAHHHLPLEMFEKLGLGHSQPPPAHDEAFSLPPEAHEESLLDKLGSRAYHASSRHDSAHAATQNHSLGLAERIADKTVTSTKLDTNAADSRFSDGHSLNSGIEGISDKIQNALGARSVGEKEEAINFIQQHIPPGSTIARDNSRADK
ncbi:hypothetical protein BT96DRAFT_925458 [Gymnopus androsaceus JB14]|uniref:Uncharacterized protein n=1 Tax=Gymnopus androsaceus JB14 TaxID=1447944 RepID=A0A6A4H0G7_9AGAR|nr:hypothetical protein BT96DRAFT_925458 [Gymnopus androsaceus JB14]